MSEHISMDMRKIKLLILCILYPICIIAQQYTEYNRKGDEAMARRDYSDARLFYSEGVIYCDMYSIYKLTGIWTLNPAMRNSMYNIMSRCLPCLTEQAQKGDTTAISKVIEYYREGIGTPKNEALVKIYEKQLEGIRNPVVATTVEAKARKAERPDIFIGYSFSTLAPVGITIGAVGKRAGGYARFKTNLSFHGYDEEFSGPEPSETSGYLHPGFKTKKDSYAFTAGLVVKCAPWLYVSAGAGYGKRDLMYLYARSDDAVTHKEDVWFKRTDASYSGLAAELDFMVKYRSFYLSAGVNTLTFEYIDLNAGVGVFF